MSTGKVFKIFMFHDEYYALQAHGRLSLSIVNYDFLCHDYEYVKTVSV